MKVESKYVNPDKYVERLKNEISRLNRQLVEECGKPKGTDWGKSKPHVGRDW